MIRKSAWGLVFVLLVWSSHRTLASLSSGVTTSFFDVALAVVPGVLGFTLILTAKEDSSWQR